MKILWFLFTHLFEEGGIALYPIFAVSVLGMYIGISKYFYLRKMERARRKIYEASQGHGFTAVTSTGNIYYDRLVEELRTAEKPSSLRTRRIYRGFLADIIPEVESGFSTMSACVSMSPLLGLFGTIRGMNKMFDVITEFGFGSPGLMAGAISLALQSTLTGLSVAVAIMFLHNFLLDRKNRCVTRIVSDGEEIAREME
jgi:biopolymer transport protein ExbB